MGFLPLKLKKGGKMSIVLNDIFRQIGLL